MPALAELVPLALFLFAFAFVYAARKLLAALFQFLIDAVNAVPIPYLGGYISEGLHAAEQAVDHALGSIVDGIDSLIGASWHRFAQLNTWLWHEFTRHTLIGWLVAQEISALAHGYHWARSQVHDLHGLSRWAHARVKSLERQYHGIEHRVKEIEHDISKGIGHDLRIGLQAAEKEIATIEHSTIPAIREAEAEAEAAISNLYEWAKGKADLIGVGTFAGAVAIALEALGLGALRCPSFLKHSKKRGCGLWDGLDNVLGLFVDLLFVANLCEVIPLLEEAYAEVAAPAIGLLTKAIDASPCVKDHQAPALDVPVLHLPPSPGFALSLP